MYVFHFFVVAFLLCFASIGRADDPPKNPPPGNNNPPPAQSDADKLAAALRREEELKAEIERLKPKEPKEPKPDDDDLLTKNRKARESADEMKRQTKLIESALGFNMGVDEFIKTNTDLLPNEVADIVKLAHKETYDDAQAKANSLKASIIQSYFSIQDNVNALTPSQKVALDDYLKLTKSGKEQKAADVYENIFEPALQMARRLKKAEEVGRSRQGYAISSEKNTAYKDKLVQISRRTHLGEKEVRA
jgi:hypothetical protein